MTLDEYLTRENITAADFGERAGLTEASVSRIRRGQQNMTRDVIRRIIAASGGAVTADGLIGPVAATPSSGAGGSPPAPFSSTSSAPPSPEREERPPRDAPLSRDTAEQAPEAA